METCKTFRVNRESHLLYKHIEKPEEPLVESPKNNRFFPVHYTSPQTTDMAVILVFYNPALSNRMIQNCLFMKYFIEKSRIPLYIGEMVFDTRPFLFPSAGNVFQFRSTSYMFYKYNLINAVESNIPRKFSKICVLDADVMFHDSDWYSLLSKALDGTDICQAYSHLHYLGLDFQPTRSQIYTSIDNHRIDSDTLIHGCAWGFRRDWYKSAEISEYNSREYNANITLCPLTVYQLYQGDTTLRIPPTDELQALMRSMHVESLADMITSKKDNILRWRSTYKDAANTIMYTHFVNRCEDGVGNANNKFIPEPYTSPSMKDMAIVLVFFNPASYLRIIQNLLIVRHMLESADIPYYIAEMAFDNKPFMLRKESNVLQYRTTSYMFYKENLICVAERAVPKLFTKLCIMDADVIFDNPNWYQIVSTTLNTVEVCQPFARCYWLDLAYTVCNSRNNCLDSKNKEIDWITEHPGFAWAFQRSWKGLLPYLNVPISTIGGDTLLHGIIKNNSAKYSSIYKVSHIPCPTYNSCSLSLYHFNHGNPQNRKYYSIMRDVGIILRGLNKNTLDELIFCRDDGVIEWKAEYATRMNTFMKDYFRDRQEDTP